MYFGMFKTTNDISRINNQIKVDDMLFLLEVTSVKPLKFNILKGHDILTSLINNGELLKTIKDLNPDEETKIS